MSALVWGWDNLFSVRRFVSTSQYFWRFIIAWRACEIFHPWTRFQWTYVNEITPSVLPKIERLGVFVCINLFRYNFVKYRILRLFSAAFASFLNEKMFLIYPPANCIPGIHFPVIFNIIVFYRCKESSRSCHPYPNFTAIDFRVFFSVVTYVFA